MLPGLVPHLPVPIPAPTHFGKPTADYPAPFVGHPYLAGETADRVDLNDAERERLPPSVRQTRMSTPGKLARLNFALRAQGGEVFFP